jgi:S1-C subfamily serine protease
MPAKASSHRPASSAVGLAAAITLAAVLTGCGSIGPTRTKADSGTSPSPAVVTQGAFVSTINRVLPSVVEIRTAAGLGSGVVFDASGDIITNAHVVGDGTSLEVLLSTSPEPVPATLVGVYQPDDLAVIKITGVKDLRPASFGDSAKLTAGDVVLAIGNPLGLSSSVTEGIVSAVGRIVSEPASHGSPGATLPDTIQTSAAINPGNSGGALATLNDEVVGIPTLAAANQSAGGAAPGIGFAISSNIAVSIARQLISTGHVTNPHRAALGVSVTTVVSPDGVPAGVGVVRLTPGGPAATAGLAAGDVITAVDGTATPDMQALARVLAALNPGRLVSVAVTRAGGASAIVHVTLGQLPGS